MDNKNMEKIALELWSSDYDVKGSIMECSSALIMINHNSFNKFRDVVSDYMFYNLEFRGISSYAHHLFQFEVWKKSMKAKTLTQATFLIILTLLFQYFLIEAITSGHKLLEVYEEAVAAHSTQAMIDAQLATHPEAARTFHKDMLITEYISFIAFFYPMRIVLEALFALKTKRSITFLGLNNFLDVALCIVFAIRIFKEHKYYNKGLENYDTQVMKDVRYFENIYEFEDDEILLDVLYSIACA